jgi:hypothetical protein
VGVNRATGRRVSVLNEKFKAELDHQCSGIWEASDDSDESDCSDESTRSSSFVDIRASRNRSAVASLFSAANVHHVGNKNDHGCDHDQPDGWKGGAWEEPDTNIDDGPTHQVTKDTKGRRVSVLNHAVMDSATMNNGQWGGFDSDESDSEGRASSMTHNPADSSLHYSRPTSTRKHDAKKQNDVAIRGGCKSASAASSSSSSSPTADDHATKKSLKSTVTNFIAKRRHSFF